jgi:polysaccharide biosynthesis protein PslL
MLNQEKATAQRLQWVDVLKGIGILTVVVGHIWQAPSKYLLLFHMPLFFFVSGYLYKPVADNKKYLIKKSLQLLVPYISFLISISFVMFLTSLNSQSFNESLFDFFKKLLQGIYGGKLLNGWFGVFWFVTCLYLTQQLYNILYQKFGKNKFQFLMVMILFYTLAYVNSIYFNNITFPWSANVVAMAILFYYSGHVFSGIVIKNKLFFLIPTFCIFISYIIANYTNLNLGLNMKYEIYGTPIINLVIAISCILILRDVANIIGMKHFSFLKSILSELGQASLVIMFLHQLIQLNMSQYSILNNDFLKIAVSIFVSLLFYKVCTRYSVTQKYFLGNFNQAR